MHDGGDDWCDGGDDDDGGGGDDDDGGGGDDDDDGDLVVMLPCPSWKRKKTSQNFQFLMISTCKRAFPYSSVALM